MIADAVNWWGLAWTQIWQIGLLGLCVGLANRMFARRRPHLAYALWCVVLAKCLLPPIVGFPPGVLGHVTPSIHWQAGTEGAAALASGEVPTADSAPVVSKVRPQPAEFAVLTRSVSRQEAVPSVAVDSPIRALEIAQRAAPLVWLAGGVLLCGFAIGRSSVVSWRLRQTSSPVAPELQLIVDDVAQRIGLRRRAEVWQTTADIGPVVMGVWRPKVYLPACLLQGIGRRQLEAMLIHELTHVRRRDTAVATLQFAAQAVWWFHPVVWWMNYRLSRERERCCDEAVVVTMQGKRADYARLLLNVLEARHRLEPLWLSPAVRPVELTQYRLEEIMKRKNMVHARSPKWCWIVAVLVAVVVLPSAAPSAAEDAKPEQTPSANQNSDAAANRPTSASRPPALLSYGDGKADGKKSYGGSGHMIRFELPEGVTKVRGLRVHGSRYGLPQAPDEDIEITFLSDDREETLDSKGVPYRLFKRGKETWVRLLFDKEVELPQKFWVCLNFNAQQTKGVYLSYDTSTKGQYSRKGLPGDEDEPQETDFGGDWMVQVMLSRPAK